MTFGQQIASTFIGAFAAFIFSLTLFYLTEKWKNSRMNKDLNRNLQKEFDFNVNFLKKFKTDYEKMLRQITADDVQIYTIFRFNKLQRLFILEAFNKGLLYQYLTVDDINDLDAMLNYFNNVSDQLSWDTLNNYKGNAGTKQEALRKFEYDKEQIEKYLKLQKSLKEKLKNLK